MKEEEPKSASFHMCLLIYALHRHRVLTSACSTSAKIIGAILESFTVSMHLKLLFQKLNGI